MSRNIVLALVGAGFVALAVVIMASSTWWSPDLWAALLFFASCMIVGLVEAVQGWWPPRPEIGPERVALHFNRAQMGVFGIAALAWTASGAIGLFGSMYPAWAAWMIILFGAACAFMLLPSALTLRARVVIDAEGIADYRTLDRKIPWSDVRAVSTSYSDGVPSVAVSLASPESYAGHRTTLARLVGRKIDPVQIAAMQLDGTLGDVFAAIAQFAPPHLQPQMAAWAQDEMVEDETEDAG